MPSASLDLKVPNKELHRRSSTARLYVSRKKVGETQEEDSLAVKFVSVGKKTV